MAYDPSQFEAVRRGLQRQYGSQSAMNEYARFLAQQRGQRNLGEFRRAVTEQLPTFARAFGQRGLRGQGVQSGVFNRAIKQFGQETARQRGYLEQDLAEEQRGFQMREAQYKSDYEQALADLEQSKPRQIAETALGLIGLNR